MLDCLIRDHTADDLSRTLANLGPSGLFIRLEVRGRRGNDLSPSVLIFLQRMSADIDPQHLLLERQEVLSGIFSDIGETDLEFFLLFFRNHIEERHLSRHGIFLLLIDMVHDLDIDRHELLAGPSERIQGA